MSPLTLQLLRRVPLYALGLALLLLVVPRVLLEVGWIGPSPEELTEGASRSIAAAAAYGADESVPAFREAREGLARARELAARGQGRASRSAARHAQARAIVAQREALIRREEVHRRAEAIVQDMDQELGRIEDLFGAVTGGRSVPGLLSRMKQARQAGGGLFLAFDQGQYAKVVQDEPAARAVVAATRKELEAVRTSRQSAPDRAPPGR